MKEEFDGRVMSPGQDRVLLRHADDPGASFSPPCKGGIRDGVMKRNG
jgi:hypothetical protein